VECASLPTPVYATGSTAAKPLLAEIGTIMAAQTPPTTVVYLGAGSCAGVDAILSGTPLMGSGTTALSYWDSTGAEQKCDITSASGIVAHIGISDVFATAIGVPADRWKGTATTSSSDLLMRVGAANFANQSIGILSAEVAQDNPSTVKVLAYQNFGQTCAILPDSGDGANDKANVRSG